MISRFFVPLPEGVEPSGSMPDLRLPEPAAHHARVVLRLRDGEPLVVFDGNGHAWQARLRFDGRVAMATDLVADDAPPADARRELVLAQALATGDKMDWIVQKATELGVAALWPLRSRRSTVRLDEARAGRREAHWQQIAISACEQSGRRRLARVLPLCDIDAALARLDAQGARGLLLDPLAAQPLGNLAPPAASQPWVIFIGPESGWDETELGRFRAASVAAVSLGRRVMRTETAGLATLAAIHARWGDFADPPNP